MKKTDKAVKFPHVHVDLSWQDGNAFFILGRVCRAMRDAGVKPEDIDEFMRQAKSGDYDHLLQTVMQTVDTD